MTSSTVPSTPTTRKSSAWPRAFAGTASKNRFWSLPTTTSYPGIVVADIKRRAAGRWPEILATLGGIDAALLDGKNHPCPKCGGTDRFRRIDADEGALFCNQCFHKDNGDGIAALQWLNGWDFATTVKALAAHLGGNGATSKAKRKSQIVASYYDYTDENGHLLYQVVRMEPKDFRQRRPKVGGGWNWSVKGVRLVPYRLPQLLAAPADVMVVIVEGEKDVDRLAKLGIVATCNAMGAGKWRGQYSEHFRDRKVVILPDNDQPGRDHAEQVARALHGNAKSIKVVALPGLPEKGDVSDWLDAGGWRVVDNPPVRFRRACAMLSLPTPTPGGNIEFLRDYLNVGPDDRPLVVAWLLAAMRPVGPYPVLCLHGEQGSAKSTTARVLRELVDPNAAPLRSEPREPRDLMIAANNGWVVALDNLSHVASWLSDALCRLSTGGGFSTRELYSDDDEMIFNATRPMILAALQAEQNTMPNPFANWKRTQDEVGRWGWKRVDLDPGDWPDFDGLPEVADFTCCECGSAEWWENLHRPVSVRFCLRCHPPTNARRLAAWAAELRQRATVGATCGNRPPDVPQDATGAADPTQNTSGP
jgi:hypothetical protein